MSTVTEYLLASALFGAAFGGPVAAQSSSENVGSRASTAPRVPDGPVALVRPGSSWRYLDDGSDQGSAWITSGFDDSGWAVGDAQLGYGDGDEATVVSYGGNPNAKYVTTYFRRNFDALQARLYTNFKLRLLCDDGAIVYLNGVEVARSNMPAGAVASDTLASSTIDGATESLFSWTDLDGSLVRPSDNVLAVEVHQRSPTSSDISFDLALLARNHEFVTRGPYLQVGTPTSMTVRWRTDDATDARVWYGVDPAHLDATVDDPTSGVLHEVTVGGLDPGTRYYYAVGKSSHVLGGGTPGHFFETSPPAGPAAPVRVWVVGDSGTGNQDARAVRDAYEDFAAGSHTDVWLMLGDNAYDAGTNSEFQAGIFDMYPELLARTVLWPTRGNHETLANVYYNQFTMPQNGEAGGMPSGTEAYYSFDFANVHFICLDSQGSSLAVGGAMWTWLSSDLASTAQEWILAYWHHPPYTKGSHDSDTEAKLVAMRENFVELLESGGVDLVLCGHSHSYERSYLIDGHYGDSSTFVEAMKVDDGDGRVDGDGAYVKVPGAHAGAVYTVAGSSGKVSTSGSLDHPAMFHSIAVLGSVVLDIGGTTMELTFLDANGQAEDHFTLEHADPFDDPVGPPVDGTRAGQRGSVR